MDECQDVKDHKENLVPDADKEWEGIFKYFSDYSEIRR
jgi:hypothetical protein